MYNEELTYGLRLKNFHYCNLKNYKLIFLFLLGLINLQKSIEINPLEEFKDICFNDYIGLSIYEIQLCSICNVDDYVADFEKFIVGYQKNISLNNTKPKEAIFYKLKNENSNLISFLKENFEFCNTSVRLINLNKNLTKCLIKGYEHLLYNKSNITSVTRIINKNNYFNYNFFKIIYICFAFFCLIFFIKLLKH